MIFTVKVNVSAMLEEYGVNVDSIKVGDNVDLLSPYSDLTKQQVRYR